ncbi:MAG: hypothetical protein QOJ15_6373 [Bradyrhizobium sp.]|jgi:hypothetical protein|nr:hypothetical protein [Bradyrhizobium sp.]
MTGSSPRPLEKRPRRLYSPGWASGEGPSEMSKLAALESRATFTERAERPRNVGVLIDEFVE